MSDSPFREPRVVRLDDGSPSNLIGVGLALVFCGVCFLVGWIVGQA